MTSFRACQLEYFDRYDMRLIRLVLWDIILSNIIMLITAIFIFTHQTMELISTYLFKNKNYIKSVRNISENLPKRWRNFLKIMIKGVQKCDFLKLFQLL